MTGQEIIDHFEFLIDDEIDSDRELILANIAYDRVNTKRRWKYLAAEDTSKTVLAATRAYALPTTFLYTDNVKFYSAATKFGPALTPAPYAERHRYEGVSGFYYLDIKNGNLVLTANPATSEIGKTIYHSYGSAPAQLTVSASPVFFRAFHPLVSFEMARMFWYGEQDEKGRSWNKELQTEYDTMLHEMEAWDAKLDTGMEPSSMPQETWLPER